MFDWDYNLFPDVSVIEVVDGFSKGKQNGTGSKQHNQYRRGKIVIQNAQWINGKLHGENVRVSMPDYLQKRVLIGNFTDNILNSGTIYFSTSEKKYKFTFNNVEITNMYEYWYPSKLKKNIHMQNRLYYYRSIIFGLQSQNENTIINTNNNNNNNSNNDKNTNQNASLYCEDGQCFHGEFIIAANQQLIFPNNQNNFNKSDLCPLYLFLSDIFKSIGSLMLFNGTITFDSFNTEKNKQNEYLSAANCPLKYTFKVKSKLIELKNRLTQNEWCGMKKLSKYLYASTNSSQIHPSANALISSFENNPTIKQMQMPTCSKTINGTIEISATVVPLDKHKHYRLYSPSFNCWQRELKLLPKSMYSIMHLAEEDKDIKLLKQHLQENDHEHHSYRLNDLIREDGYTVHYYGSCKLYSNIFYRMPFLVHGNGVLYIQCKDVIKKHYLKQNDLQKSGKNDKNIKNMKNGGKNNRLCIDGEKYLLKADVCCTKSNIDKISFVKQVTLNENENDTIRSAILQIRLLQCGVVNGTGSTVDQALIILEQINKLQAQAQQQQKQQKQQKRQQRQKQNQSIDVKIYNQMSRFLTSLNAGMKCEDYIVYSWQNSQVIELLYRSQCYTLMEKCFELVANQPNNSAYRSDSQGWNLLHYAAYLNDVKYIRLYQKILKSDVKLLIRPYNGSINLVPRSLLLNTDLVSHSMPIHIAVQNGHIKILREFVKNYKKLGCSTISALNGANGQFFTKTYDGWTALELAIIQDQPKCFEFLYSEMEYVLHRVDYNGFSLNTLAAQS